MIRIRFRKQVLVLAILMGLHFASSTGAHGQDTTIYIDLPNQTASVGDTIRIPIWLANYTYPIAGFSLTFTMDRPGLIEFSGTPLFDPEGTLIQAWDQRGAFQPSPSSVRTSGIADFDLNNQPPPIPPLTLGETLVYIMARVPCDPDTISGTIVDLLPTGLAEFSDPEGTLILPVSAAGGMIQIVAAQRGDLDHSGAFDILDVIALVNCAFRNLCPECGSAPADVTCDGSVDIIDVVTMVGFVFRSQPLPPCP